MVADPTKVLIFNKKSGAYIRTIVLPNLFDTRLDHDYGYRELDGVKCHTNFALSEDGIIMFHHQRNFPIAADVLLFW